MKTRTGDAFLRTSLRRLIPGLVLCAIVIGVPGRPAAQERKILRIEGDDPVFVLRELMVVLAEEEGKVFVKIALPRRPGGKTGSGEKLAENDVILRVNGKKTATVAELKKLYDASKPGDTFKIGVKRGDERFIVSFAKADPKDMPEGMMIRTIEAPADSADGRKKE